MADRLYKKELLDKPLFFDKIPIELKNVFPMVVMATMSSGKSTLINALLGQDILPNRNKACTAKIYSVFDDDNCTEPVAYTVDVNNNIRTVRENISEVLSEANTDENIKYIHINTNIAGVLNAERSLFVLDTPGPNNSIDLSHEVITNAVLNQLNGGLILYVINATQLGIADDKELLKKVKRRIKLFDNIKILFVVNKIDLIDTEKESLSDFVDDCIEYLEELGFDSPNIIPVSSLAASLFKKVIAGEKLTRVEQSDFYYCYDFFKSSDNRMLSYAVTDTLPDQRKTVELNGDTFKVADLLAAIENTGITFLEKYIQYEQIKSK